jgi:NAD(P)H dehydrogenase (quinone)
MILITGASGRVGSRVARYLVSQQQPVRLMSRTPDELSDFEGVEKVFGDFNDRESLDSAFEGIYTVLVISGQDIPGNRCVGHKTAFDAAKEANIGHVVYLSLLGASPDSAYPYCRDHYQSEKWLAESGVAYTTLRNAFYIDYFLEQFDDDGVIRGPGGTGNGAFISRDDAARAATAAVLKKPGGVQEITGPELLSIDDVARRLGYLVGRDLSYKSEFVTEAHERLENDEAPQLVQNLEIGWFQAIAEGEQSKLSDDFSKLTNAEPQTLEEYFTEHPELLKELRSPSVSES